MRYSVTFSALLFAACGWASPAIAQMVPNRDSAEHYFNQGNFYKYQAEDDWTVDTSATVSPGHLSVAEARGQAIFCYTKSIAFDSSYYWSYRNRGRCYQISKAYALALADYNRAVLCENNLSGELEGVRELSRR